MASLVLLFMARSNDAGATPDVSTHAIAVVILGGLLNSLLLSVFRGGEIKRFANPYYTIPSWRPSLLASILVLVGWVAALVASYWIGLSWSRR